MSAADAVPVTPMIVDSAMSNRFMFAPLHSRDDQLSAVVALSARERYLRLRSNTVAARAQ
jgi:hypothetical protein